MNTNQFKRECLEDIKHTTSQLKCQIRVLNSLDEDITHVNAYDLQDQMTTYMQLLNDLNQLNKRVDTIIPK